jgi:hypothetical protein
MALEEAAAGAPGAMATLASLDQTARSRALTVPENAQPKLGGVEQASYQAAEATPSHSPPWDKMFK